MQLPATLKAVRFKLPVQCGPRSSPAETVYTAGDTVHLSLERGCVFLARTVQVDGNPLVHIRGVPLSGGNVVDLDFGSHAPEALQESPPEASVQVDVSPAPALQHAPQSTEAVEVSKPKRQPKAKKPEGVK